MYFELRTFHSPPPETGNFTCKSVMYYYDEKECVLNTESRFTKKELFMPEIDEFSVDYYDLNCKQEVVSCNDIASTLF